MTTPQPLLDTAEMPQPFRLPWGLVILLSALTLGLFGAVMLVLQANWVRRIRGGWLALTFAIACATSCIFDVAASHLPLRQLSIWAHSDYWGEIDFALWVAAVYTLRQQLMAPPIGLLLGRVLPLFIGPVYFQYFLQDFTQTNRSGRPPNL